MIQVTDESTLAQFAEHWGLEAQIDLEECAPELIRDADHIKMFCAQLCSLIGMKSFGPCQVVHFGDEPRVYGYSMVQLIETSLISAHFAEEADAAYINIFSCAPFEPLQAASFCKSFFLARNSQVRTTFRG